MSDMAQATQKAGATMEATAEALENVIGLRDTIRADLEDELARFVGDARPVSEVRHDEHEFTRNMPVYAEGADLDDPNVEPIDWVVVPMVAFRATRLFVPVTGKDD